MLQPAQYPEGVNGYPKLPKSEAMKASAAYMNAAFRYLDINVTFEDRKNNAGVDQYKCELCGDCMTGCNYGAKNTTLMNYLPDAPDSWGQNIYRRSRTISQPDRWEMGGALPDRRRRKRKIQGARSFRYGRYRGRRSWMPGKYRNIYSAPGRRAWRSRTSWGNALPVTGMFWPLPITRM